MKYLFAILLYTGLNVCFSQIVTVNFCNSAESIDDVNTVEGETTKWFVYRMDSRSDGRVRITSNGNTLRYGLWKREEPCQNYTADQENYIGPHVWQRPAYVYLLADEYLYISATNYDISNNGIFIDIVGQSCRLPDEITINANNSHNVNTKFPGYKVRGVMPTVDAKLVVEFETEEEVHGFTVSAQCDTDSFYSFTQTSPTTWESVEQIPASSDVFFEFDTGSTGEPFRWYAHAFSGENPDLAIPVEEGSHQLSNENGIAYSRVFYSYQAHANELITVNTPSDNPSLGRIYPASFVNASTNFNSDPTDWYAGNPYTSFYSDQNQELIIEWYVQGIENLQWQLSSREGEVGDDCNNAIEASEGVNSVTQLDKKRYYYTYTMPTDSRVRLESDADYYVNILNEDCDAHVPYKFSDPGNSGFSILSEGEVPVIVQEGNDPPSQGSLVEPGHYEGDTIIIYWEPDGLFSLGNDFEWTLTLETPDPGEDCRHAIDAIEGENVFPSNELTNEYWYSYTATETGKVHFSASQSFIDVDIYKNQVCDELITKERIQTSSLFGNTKIPTVLVEPEDQLFLIWEGNGNDLSGETFTVHFDPLEIGDNADMPITAMEGANNKPESVSNTIWFSYNIPETQTLSQNANQKIVIETELNRWIEVYRRVDDELVLLKSTSKYLEIKEFNSGEELLISLESGNDNSAYDWTLTLASLETGDLCSMATPLVLDALNDVGYSPYWYSYTPEETGIYAISKSTSLFDAEDISVFMECDGSLIETDRLVIVPTTFSNKLKMTLDANETYYIKWETVEDLSWGFVREFSVQNITFDPIETKIYGQDAFELNGESSSGLPVTYTATEGNSLVSIDGDVVTLLGVGDVTIEASQPGDNFHHGASPESQSFTIVEGNQFITVDPISDKLTSDEPFEIEASIDSGLDLEYDVEGPATIAGNLITLNGTPGEVVVTITQNNSDLYLPASAFTSFTVIQSEEEEVLNSENEIETIIYPNPFTNTILVENTEISSLKLLNLVGQEIANSTSHKLEGLNGIPSGVYLLEIVHPNGRTSRVRLVKK